MFGLDAHEEIYTTVGPAVMICQMLSVLEVLHPLLGWVRTGALMPFIQVSVPVVLCHFATFPVKNINFIVRLRM